MCNFFKMLFDALSPFFALENTKSDQFKNAVIFGNDENARGFRSMKHYDGRTVALPAFFGT